MEKFCFTNGINQPDLSMDSSSLDPDHKKKDLEVFSSNYRAQILPESLLGRRYFLKLAILGTTSVFLPSINAFPSIPANESFGTEIIRGSPQNEANPILFPDGSVVIFFMVRSKHVASIQSRDNGLTWSDPKVEFSVSGETTFACRSLLDKNLEVHVWFLQKGEEKSGLSGNRHMDIWHAHTIDGGSAWSKPALIWKGYCGAIRGALQMERGRFIVPVGVWKTSRDKLPGNTGSNYTTVILSDDGGKTWRQSSTVLVSPVYVGYNGNNYGACEPCIIKIPHGPLWLLIRTQTGFLYESFSSDGLSWTSATPSRFLTSNSPAGVVSLKDNRIVVFWNNHQLPSRVDGQGVYGVRDSLHAAISDDSGKTWLGFREVYLDPTRNASPPKSGDRGTAYPNGEVTADGYIILVTGQGERARVIIRFHPSWLYETYREHDFTSDGLKTWSVYKGIGPAQGWWRERIPGACLIAHPDKSSAKVLHVRRPDKHAADGATWNFPAGQKGILSLRFLINTGFRGAQISLADRLFDPTDGQGNSFPILSCTWRQPAVSVKGLSSPLSAGIRSPLLGISGKEVVRLKLTEMKFAVCP